MRLKSRLVERSFATFFLQAQHSEVHQPRTSVVARELWAKVGRIALEQALEATMATMKMSALRQ